MLMFMVLWFTFSYLPIAHMVWYWAGPDAYTSAEAADKATATAGFLFQKGAIDFAGGTVVHINAGIAGLVGALVIGKRLGYGKEPMAPHSLTMTMIGAALLWMGWFGFNVGSNLEATGTAALAFCNTLFATAAAAMRLDVRRVDLPREADHAGRGFGRGRRTGRDHAGLRLRRSDGCDRHRHRRWPGLPVGGDLAEEQARLRRFARRVRRALHRRYHRCARHRYLGRAGLGGTGVYDYVANKVGDYDMATQVHQSAVGRRHVAGLVRRGRVHRATRSSIW